MHPDYEVEVIEFDGTTPEEEINAAFDAMQDAMIADQKNIEETLGVSPGCAQSISYLRGRSRWTQEKEDLLVSLDKAGKPLPNVYTGEEI